MGSGSLGIGAGESRAAGSEVGTAGGSMAGPTEGIGGSATRSARTNCPSGGEEGGPLLHASGLAGGRIMISGGAAQSRSRPDGATVSGSPWGRGSASRRRAGASGGGALAASGAEGAAATTRSAKSKFELAAPSGVDGAGRPTAASGPTLAAAFWKAALSPKRSFAGARVTPGTTGGCGPRTPCQMCETASGRLRRRPPRRRLERPERREGPLASRRGGPVG